MDLLNQMHGVLQLDCENQLWLEGQPPHDRRILIQDDEALVIWIKEIGDEGDNHLHLFVEAMGRTLEPLLEEPKVIISNPNIEYHWKADSRVSDEDNAGTGIDDFIVSESNGD